MGGHKMALTANSISALNKTKQLPAIDTSQAVNIHVDSEPKNQTAEVNPVLNEVEVNNQIQAKFFKVISDYGECTGYMIDDQKGLMLSSFHLISAIKPIKITTEFDAYINSFLHSIGYIDEEFRLKKEALEVKSREEIIEKIRQLEIVKEITKRVRITPKDIKDFLNDIKRKSWMDQAIKDVLKNSENRFHFNENDPGQTKLAITLAKSGYLNDKFCPTEKLKKIILPNDLTDIIPITESYTLLFKEMDVKIFQKTKGILIDEQSGFPDRIFQFFQKGKSEKDVVLLSRTVEIECDNEILIGEIQIPKDIKSDEEQRVLKNFAYFDTMPIKIIGFKNGSQLTDGTKVILTGKEIPPIPEDEEEPMIGEKVYFGGYPLTQQVYTFSTGIISAVTFSGYRICFVIEAPIAPGNSGSPVFIQRNGQIYFIGIINSEVAHVSEKMLDIQERLKNQPEIMQAGSISLIETMRELTETLLVNLSTGKGKAFQVPSITNLVDPNFICHDGITIDPFLDFLVPKKPKKEKNNIREEIKKEIDENLKNRRIFNAYEYKGRVYYLGADKHNKHTAQTKYVTKKLKDNPRFLQEKWGRKEATFNQHVFDNYQEILNQVVRAIANSDEKSNFVSFDFPIGWDSGTSKQGEETTIIELYYEEQGSHIRPKALSRIKQEYVPNIISYTSTLELTDRLQACAENFSSNQDSDVGTELSPTVELSFTAPVENVSPVVSSTPTNDGKSSENLPPATAASTIP